MNIQSINAKTNSAVSCEACSLAGLCVTNGLSPEELVDFEKIVNITPILKKNDYLYRSGDQIKAIYAVKSGALKGTLTDADGNLHITGFYTPGDIIGFDGLADETHICDLIALDDSRVCELPIDQIDALSSDIPALRKELRCQGGRKHNSLQKLLMLIGKRPVDERIAVFLLNIVDKYRKRGLSPARIHLPMSRHEIANYLGMAPETLSRQLKRFQQKQHIKISDKYCEIKDEQALKLIAKTCQPGDPGQEKQAG